MTKKYLMKMHNKKGVWIDHYKVKVWDRKWYGDRYTIAADGGTNGDRHVFCANSTPFHPAYGIGMYVGTLYYEDWDDGEGNTHRYHGYRPSSEWGKLVAYDTLPDDVKKFIEIRLADDEDAGGEQ